MKKNKPYASLVFIRFINFKSFLIYPFFKNFESQSYHLYEIIEIQYFLQILDVNVKISH